ncbi:MAG: TerB N-terminal domain-containing protein [Tumebacillaceae bacterium]
MPGPLDLGELKAKQFREQVIRFRESIGTPAPEIEFIHSWPKHEHLDECQLHWFLYWRTLWEDGQVVKTSLSYMMIHIYELLSLEYIKEPEKAVKRLIEFYTEFRNIQPRLDVTVVRWIGDMYLKIGDLENAMYWYTHGPYGDLYEKLSWYRYGEMDIPFSMLLKVAPMQKTQFYRDAMPEIENAMETMMHAVFRSFYALEGEHALDRFARYTDDPTIYLFSSTPIHEKIFLDGFRRYEESGAFVHFVKNCVRYAENLLRRAAGKSKLKCDESVGKYFQELEALYPAPPPAEKQEKGKKEKETLREAPVLSREMPEQPVEIDFSRVRTLTEETDWLVDMMQESEAAEELLLEEQAVQPQVTETEREAVSPNYIGNLFAGNEAGELEEFLDELAPAEQELLRHLAQQGSQERRVLSEWLKQKRMFLDATVLSLNERAMDAGFEPVVEDDGEQVYVAEEYEAAIGGWVLKEEMGR